MEKQYLYGLTVQGIQSYIFATNKLKEIIGASEIIEQLCTTWFDEFLTDKEKTDSIKHLNAAGNIRFQTDKKTAKRIFTNYHSLLLKKAPGVPFSQAVVPIETGKEYEAIQNLDKKLRGQRNVPLYESDLGVMTRSKYRPIGSFACLENDKVKDDNKFVDVVTSAKYNNCDEKVLSKKVKIEGYDLTYPSEFKTLAQEGKHSWLAVVHIDGNGMGLIIKDILENDENKFESLQEFSKNIAICTITAFKEAVKKIVVPAGIKDEKNNSTILPLRPLIIGGDDVTVIIRADLALKFTQVYLNAFERETKNAKLNNDEGLTACAGIAYVKEKFPFHYSANLAEELCVYAKNKCERKASCVQFHKVQDSIIDNYKEIVKRELTTTENFKFQNGPYYLDNDTDNEKISNLVETVEKLQQEDAPTNGMREWVDAKFNNPTMEKTLMERLEKKTPKEYKDILEKSKTFIDYHTLLSVTPISVTPKTN